MSDHGHSSRIPEHGTQCCSKFWSWWMCWTTSRCSRSHPTAMTLLTMAIQDSTCARHTTLLWMAKYYLWAFSAAPSRRFHCATYYAGGD